MDGFIGRAAGGMAHASPTRALDLLVAKRIVEVDVPLSVRPSRESRYSIAGPDLGRLIVHRSKPPGADDSTPLLAISRNGVDRSVSGVSAFGPDDLIAAWRTGADADG